MLKVGPSARRGLPALFVACLVAVGFVAGSAVVAEAVLNSDDHPANVSTTPEGRPNPASNPTYPVNERGQTYGDPDSSVPFDSLPDLLLVAATNGRSGYIDTAQWKELTGANVSSPEEAIEWQRQMDEATWDRIEIRVYESDGTTEIGKFPIERSRPVEAPRAG